MRKRLTHCPKLKQIKKPVQSFRGFLLKHIFIIFITFSNRNHEVFPHFWVLVLRVAL